MPGYGSLALGPPNATSPLHDAGAESAGPRASKPIPGSAFRIPDRGPGARFRSGTSAIPPLPWRRFAAGARPDTGAGRGGGTAAARGGPGGPFRRGGGPCHCGPRSGGCPLAGAAAGARLGGSGARDGDTGGRGGGGLGPGPRRSGADPLRVGAPPFAGPLGEPFARAGALRLGARGPLAWAGAGCPVGRMPLAAWPFGRRPGGSCGGRPDLGGGGPRPLPSFPGGPDAIAAAVASPEAQTATDGVRSACTRPLAPRSPSCQPMWPR